jgi:rod shape-determining protein MreC
LLVSSGLGQRFPAGYPVATVKEVIHDSGQPFAIVRAIPTAALNRSRYLLLVFSDTRTPEERANDAAQAQESLDAQGGGPIIPATVPKVVNPVAPAASAAAPAAPAPAAPAATAPAKPATTPAKPAATHPAAAKPPAAQPAAAKPAAKPPVSAPATPVGRE